jgi:hypothetical protein
MLVKRRWSSHVVAQEAEASYRGLIKTSAGLDLGPTSKIYPRGSRIDCFMTGFTPVARNVFQRCGPFCEAKSKLPNSTILFRRSCHVMSEQISFYPVFRRAPVPEVRRANVFEWN